MSQSIETPLFKLLTKLGAKQAGEVNEWYLNCPFCVERGEPRPDTRWRLGLNSANGSARCPNCEYRAFGIRRVCLDLCRVYGITHGITTRTSVPASGSTEKTRLRAIGLPEGYEKFAGGTDYVERKALAYARKRGITDDQIARHQIGYAAAGKYGYRLIFPVIGLNQKIYGYVCRAFAKQAPPYLNSPGLKLCWGANQRADVAILSEGIMDALAVERMLEDYDMGTGETYASLAKLGSTVTPQQIVQLKRYKRVIVLPDLDPMGIKGCLSTNAMFQRDGINASFCIPEKLTGEDPGSLSSDKLFKFLQRQHRVGKSIEFRLRKISA